MFYLIGIKGSGMSALACILHDLGHKVVGLDFDIYYKTEDELRKREIEIFDFEYDKFDLEAQFIIGNAFSNHNIFERIKTLTNNYFFYQDFINMYFKQHQIAVSGCHGKTTTTKFLTQLIDEPFSYLIGDGSGKGDKDAKYFVFEACEYKDHFLAYLPDTLIITNIDYDHPDYFKSIEQTFESFQKLACKADFVVVNGDCPYCKKIKGLYKITVGYDSTSDICIKLEYPYIIFTGLLEDKVCFSHNSKEIALDFALAYVSVKFNDIKLKNNFTLILPTRRLEKLSDEPLVYTDYAHHPVEIETSIQYFKKTYPNKKIMIIYEFHTFTRLDKFLDEFVKVLDLADEVLFTEVFSSVREVGYKDLSEIITLNNKFYQYNKETFIDRDISDYVVVYMGAGNSDKYAFDYLKKLNP